MQESEVPRKFYSPTEIATSAYDDYHSMIIIEFGLAASNTTSLSLSLLFAVMGTPHSLPFSLAAKIHRQITNPPPIGIGIGTGIAIGIGIEIEIERWIINIQKIIIREIKSRVLKKNKQTNKKSI